jgi:hypothetical protein
MEVDVVLVSAGALAPCRCKVTHKVCITLLASHMLQLACFACHKLTTGCFLSCGCQVAGRT